MFIVFVEIKIQEFSLILQLFYFIFWDWDMAELSCASMYCSLAGLRPISLNCLPASTIFIDLEHLTY